MSVNDTITIQVQDAVDAIAAREAVHTVFLAACGGSFAMLGPAKYVLDHESADTAAHHLNAREFTHRAPKSLGKGSVVIAASHSGTTPETVDAAAYGRDHGALVIAITNDGESPLAQNADHVVTYVHGPDIDLHDSSEGVLYRVVFGYLAAREGNTAGKNIDASLSALNGTLKKTRDDNAGAADTWAAAHKKHELVYTMASGSNFHEAYAFSICLLQEMQWVHSAAIHAGEYFHGPFEITDKDVPFIVLAGIGETRPLDTRAIDFVAKYSDDVVVLDADEMELTGVDESLRGYLAVIIFGKWLRLYADALADYRGHPLSVRRYMWRMEY
ncbi:SIS domain-containing protein [Spelaeicoccus albus]|uniref:Fructoselysine 6-phosphate deglycase n=1 Tax=Spelaeicoccus albus TaxID=1280376 RepID=A0A7Z0D251_9MICO|nr:SIS domain-containing protein [Spelaeicoccus albus]NYI67484.1 fructoselysine 6-phosphate deglycase [Spelaeicoccus albus]